MGEAKIGMGMSVQVGENVGFYFSVNDVVDHLVKLKNRGDYVRFPDDLLNCFGTILFRNRYIESKITAEERRLMVVARQYETAEDPSVAHEEWVLGFELDEELGEDWMDKRHRFPPSNHISPFMIFDKVKPSLERYFNDPPLEESIVWGWVRENSPDEEDDDLLASEDDLFAAKLLALRTRIFGDRIFGDVTDFYWPPAFATSFHFGHTIGNGLINLALSITANAVGMVSNGTISDPADDERQSLDVEDDWVGQVAERFELNDHSDWVKHAVETFELKDDSDETTPLNADDLALLSKNAIRHLQPVIIDTLEKVAELAKRRRRSGDDV